MTVFKFVTVLNDGGGEGAVTVSNWVDVAVEVVVVKAVAVVGTAITQEQYRLAVDCTLELVLKPLMTVETVEQVNARFARAAGITTGFA